MATTLKSRTRFNKSQNVEVHNVSFARVFQQRVNYYALQLDLKTCVVDGVDAAHDIRTFFAAGVRSKLAAHFVRIGLTSALRRRLTSHHPMILRLVTMETVC